MKISKPAEVEVTADSETDTIDALSADGSLRPGYLRDYISGLPLKATPEEIEAVQIFAQRSLVEDYRYPKNASKHAPVFRVRIGPPMKAGPFPVDIAVFRSQA